MALDRHAHRAEVSLGALDLDLFPVREPVVLAHSPQRPAVVLVVAAGLAAVGAVEDAIVERADLGHRAVHRADLVVRVDQAELEHERNGLVGRNASALRQLARRAVGPREVLDFLELLRRNNNYKSEGKP